MLQVEEWIAIAAALSVIVLSGCYLLYFKITKKLFPEMANVKKNIEPNKGATISAIDGVGRIKTVEIKTNGVSSVTITIDGCNRTLLIIQSDELIKANNFLNLIIHESLDQEFKNNYSIFIENKSDRCITANVVVSFEMRKNFKTTLRAIFSEF